MFVFRVLNTVPFSNEEGAKDVIASLHSFVTYNVLIGLAVLVSWKQFGGRPMECMVPPDFTNAWVQYAENYCWAQDTYFLPFETAPAALREGDAEAMEAVQKVSYYQWIPFFLLFEAACFKIPCLIWKYFASQSGMRVGEILRLSTDEHNAVPEVKKSNIQALCIHLQGALRFQTRLKSRNLVPHKILRFINIKYSTYYVTFIYFMTKIAFLLNVVVQSSLLTTYLLPKSHENFGLDVWKSLWMGNVTWKESGVFPRVTLCDFEVREMGNIQNHTVQCFLLINIFTEKIFLIMWIWYIVLISITIGNMFSWIFTLFSETTREHFIYNHLEMSETGDFKSDKQDCREAVDRFVDKYLGYDGILLLNLIAQHADVVFTTELISSLWSSHQMIEEQRRFRKDLKEKDKMLKEITHMDGKMNGSPDFDGAANFIRKESAAQLYQQHPRMLKRASSVTIDDVDESNKKKFEESSSDEDTSSKQDSKKNSKKNSKNNSRRNSHAQGV